MPYLRLSISLLFVVSSLSCRFDEQLLTLSLGTSSPYVPQQDAQSYEMHSGYDPVFINHVGRHGSRYISSLSGLAKITTAIDDAKKKGRLVGENAKAFFNWYEDFSFTQRYFLSSSGSGDANITAQGAKELFGIGKRMASNFPELFANIKNDIGANKKPIYATSTFKSRAINSGDAMLAGIIDELTNGAQIYDKKKPEQFGIVRDFTRQACNDLVLRFFDQCPSYDTYWDSTAAMIQKITMPFQDSPESKQSSAFVSNRVFSHGDDSTGLAKQLYKMCQSDAAYDAERAKNRFCGLFRNTDLARFEYVDDVNDYFIKGPGLENYSDSATPMISVSMSCLLLDDILQTTQAAIDGHFAEKLHLRFAHAETIIPIVSLMGLASGDVGDNPVPFVSNRSWKMSKISPMAANLQIVLHQKRNGSSAGPDYLVKVLLNEREIGFPEQAHCAETTGSPLFCSWQNFKTYYEKLACNLDEYWNRCSCSGKANAKDSSGCKCVLGGDD